ncbi:peroxiredoxin-like family protein [soil metagenome]
MRLLSITVTLILIAYSLMAQSVNVPQESSAISPLLIGEKIPSTSLFDMNGKSVNLQELAGRKQSILVFYRGGWCPYCNLHLAELQTIEPDILAAGYQIIAISPDSPESLRASADKNKLNYVLLSDHDGELIKAFGLAFKAPLGYAELLTKSSGGKNKDMLLPVPAVFILNRQGEILFEYINPDYKKRLKGSLLMAVLKELKE